MTTNLFVVANVKQLRTGGSFRILLPFFRIFWGGGFVGVLNSAIFNSFHNWVEFGRFWGVFGISWGWGGLNATNPPPQNGTPKV